MKIHVVPLSSTLSKKRAYQNGIKTLKNDLKNAYDGLFVTDFDGTLLRTDGTFAKQDLDALESLRQRGVRTAIATGRSHYSFINSPGVDLAVDYIIFTTGAGVVRQSGDELLYQISISPEMVTNALEFLNQSGLDFMLHRPVPQNHEYVFRRSNPYNTDFETRIEKYSQFGTPLDDMAPGEFGAASQFLIIVPFDETHVALKKVEEGLPGLSVVRATSPLDHHSTWVEIFHPDVSKGKTAAWLASKLGVSNKDTMAIGNDYNDLDLLEWAAHGYVVDNAPDEMKQRFQPVASNNNGGVSEAVCHWIKQRDLNTSL